MKFEGIIPEIMSVVVNLSDFSNGWYQNKPDGWFVNLFCRK